MLSIYINGAAALRCRTYTPTAGSPYKSSASGAPASANPSPASIDSAPVTASIRRTRCRTRAMLRQVWARVISGISKPDSAASTENGKNSSGSAMPFKAPYCASASARLPVYSVSVYGISPLSAACRPPASRRLPSTGRTMAYSSLAV